MYKFKVYRITFNSSKIIFPYRIFTDRIKKKDSIERRTTNSKN